MICTRQRVGNEKECLECWQSELRHYICHPRIRPCFSERLCVRGMRAHHGPMQTLKKLVKRQRVSTNALFQQGLSSSTVVGRIPLACQDPTTTRPGRPDRRSMEASLVVCTDGWGGRHAMGDCEVGLCLHEEDKQGTLVDSAWAAHLGSTTFRSGVALWPDLLLGFPEAGVESCIETLHHMRATTPSDSICFGTHVRALSARLSPQHLIGK